MVTIRTEMINQIFQMIHGGSINVVERNCQIRAATRTLPQKGRKTIIKSQERQISCAVFIKILAI